MKFNLKEKFNAFVHKHIAREFTMEDAARAFAPEIQRLLFNLNTQNANYTREHVTAAVHMLDFSKWKYGVDPLLSDYKDLEPVVKYMIDNGDIYQVLNVDQALEREKQARAEQAAIFAERMARLRHNPI